MVHLTKTPLASIRRAAVYENPKKLPLSKIVEEQQPDIAFTGVFYNSKWKPVCPVKADGKVLYADTQYNYWALAWNEGSDAAPELILPGGVSEKANYAANCVLITGAKPHEKLYYGKDVGGIRGRVATGLTAAGEWLVFASTDNSSGAITPEALRDFMADQGCEFAVMMDGGRKVNYYNRAEGVLEEGKDPSQTLILLWLHDNTAPEEVGPMAINIRAYSKAKSGSEKAYMSDGKRCTNFKVREFACKDGTDPVFIAPELVTVLQKIRSYFGKAVTITSAYRTPQHNAKEGGVADSQHCYGMAADVVVKDTPPAEVGAYARKLMPDWGGIGVYDTFTHIDVRETESRWNG